MKTIKLFVILANRDTTEGRGPMYPIGYTEDKLLAKQIVSSEEYAKKYGVMGTPGTPEYDVKPEEIVIFEALSEFTKKRTADIREAALKKLTNEEKRVLGLD